MSEKFIRLLARNYPTIEKASARIIELQATSVLPKGTEYFLSDLHGQYDSFNRIIRSASGNTRLKIDLEFHNELSDAAQNELANLIYEPTKFIRILKEEERFTKCWIRETITQLIRLTKRVASKYPREKVRRKMPEDYRDIIDEMINVYYEELNKKEYYHTVVESIINTNAAEKFIIALCHLIQDINIDWLHIIGDIFDRGERPDYIMDTLIDKKDVDIQWGNHDVSWIGAALGNQALIANCVRIAISYNNFDSLEDAYGINLRALSSYADWVYHDDPCARFRIRKMSENKFDEIDDMTASKMHKAISIIQFKLATKLIQDKYSEQMPHRDVLNHTDFHRFVYTDREGREHPLLDKNFPTIDPDNPTKLTRGEMLVIDSLTSSFKHSQRLQEHIQFLLSKGSSYKIVNSNLLFHGCIPMTEEGEFDVFEYQGKKYSGKSLFDFINHKIRDAVILPEDHADKQDAIDFLWYLWCGPKSPMFGKSQLSAFENFFITDKKARKEYYNAYYRLSKEEKYVDKIFEEFGLDKKTSHIINGHVPVKHIDGEHPIHAGGKVYVIDGGMSLAYQKKTGIAGYTMTFNSHHLAMAQHQSFSHMENVSGAYTPKLTITETFPKRMLIRDTDSGKEMYEMIQDLKELIRCYENGLLKEGTDPKYY